MSVESHLLRRSSPVHRRTGLLLIGAGILVATVMITFVQRSSYPKVTQLFETLPQSDKDTPWQLAYLQPQIRRLPQMMLASRLPQIMLDGQEEPAEEEPAEEEPAEEDEEEKPDLPKMTMNWDPETVRVQNTGQGNGKSGIFLGPIYQGAL